MGLKATIAGLIGGMDAEAVADRIERIHREERIILSGSGFRTEME